MAEVSDELPVVTWRDDHDRAFGYLEVRSPTAKDLVVHFSAFFGAWGDAKVYRDQFKGYFHRAKMLGSDPSHNWLFLCDTYGAFDNGTYYTGHQGDFFVERAMLTILRDRMAVLGIEADRVVLVGSSMGATAALKFGLVLGARGIVAIGPHIDLDLSAKFQNRMAEVAFICPDGEALAEHNYPFTRQIRELAGSSSVLPRLFVQSCADDVGVHAEQVLPLVRQWSQRGGDVTVDERLVGGHTSDYATRGVLLDAVARLYDGQAIDVDRYQNDPELRGALVLPPLTHRLRRRASLLRTRLLGRN